MPDKPPQQTKQEKLIEADQHIAAAESLVAKQISVLDQLQRDGHQTENARALLDTMRASLQQMYAHRQIIEAEPDSG